MTSDAEGSEALTLAAVLAERAVRHPHRPFLFWPEGLDWRWMALAEAVGEVERLGAGTAARAAEERAVPPAVVELLERIAGGETGAGGAAGPGPGPVAGADGLVDGEGLGGTPAADDVAGSASRRPRREVVVLSPPFADAGGRDLLAWAVLAGAAVVVEPSRAGLVATAAWARPTVFRGTAAEIAALAVEAAAAERAGFAGFRRRLRRWLGGEPPPPRPFGRLHTLLVADAPTHAVDAAFWGARGTRVVAEAE